MLTMPTDGVGSGYPLHEPDQRGGAVRREHELPVVGQHGEGDEPYRVFREPLFQYLQKGPIIRRAHEDRDAPYTAMQDVNIRGGEAGAERTRH
jgi:hypothetical protein